MPAEISRSPVFDNLVEEKVVSKADALDTVPAYAPNAPYIILGSAPYTRAAREIRKERALNNLAESFKADSYNRRSWTQRGLPKQCIQEIIELGPKLDQNTMDAIEYHAAVEFRTGSYVQQGLQMITDSFARVTILTEWGDQEGKHGPALMYGLLLSDTLDSKRDPKKRWNEVKAAKFIKEAMDNPWRAQDHAGMRDEIDFSIYPGVIDEDITFMAYAAVQELVTQWNYIKGLRRIVRANYGLPEQQTPEEISRGFEVGLSEPIRRVAGDEGPHYVLYGDQLRIYAQLDPYTTFDALQRVQGGFKMPLTGLLDNGEAVAKTIYPDGKRGVVLANGRAFDKVAQKLGLEDRKAIKTAAEQSIGFAEIVEPQIIKLHKNGLFVATNDYEDVITSLKAA